LPEEAFNSLGVVPFATEGAFIRAKDVHASEELSGMFGLELLLAKAHANYWVLVI
jgi:hypothetical protein